MTQPRAYYNEIEPFAADWIRSLIARGLIAPGDVDTRSITDVRPDDLGGYTQCHFFAGIGGWSYALRQAGWDDARPVWTGSCPCQPFSLAGKQKGFDDERHLWPVWRELIRECAPAVVFGEQVASATEWLGLVRGDLEAMGRAVGAMPIQAASAGADHLRDRYWFVAYDLAHAVGERGCGRDDPRQDAAHADTSGQGSGTMADADQLGACTEGSERGRQFRGTGGDPEACAGELADAAGHDEQRDWQPGASSEPQVTAGGLCAAGDLSDAGSGLLRHEGRGEPAGATSQVCGEVREQRLRPDAGPVCDSGAALEWVIGSDGKARRVKPGIRLLAHGVPNRVGTLRGFGNAIDYRPAKEFIGAFIDTMMAPALSSKK